jgi:hypothetical protein
LHDHQHESAVIARGVARARPLTAYAPTVNDGSDGGTQAMIRARSSEAGVLARMTEAIRAARSEFAKMQRLTTREPEV